MNVYLCFLIYLKMNGNNTKICRLCFKVSDSETESAFQTIGEGIKVMLSSLLPNLDLAISDEPVVCESCTENLKKCCDYKAACLGALDVQKICPSEKSDRNTVSNLDDYSLCGLCMKLTECGSFVRLKNEDVGLMVMLQIYFSGLDLSFTNEPVTCLSCYESLRHLFSFTSKCLSIEERIKKYCVAEGINSKSKVQLSRVLQFTLKSILKSESDCYNSSAVKVEEICYEEGQTSNIAEIKNENFVETEEELYIKKDGIKMEQGYNCSLEKNIPFLQTNDEVEERNNTKLLSVTQASTLEVTIYDSEICTIEMKQRNITESRMQVLECSSEAEVYKCETCGFLTKYKYYLKEHMLTHESASNITWYKCDMCVYQTKRKSNLRTHKLTHKSSSELTMYKCEICAYKTIHCHGIQRHMLIHKNTSEVAQYKCDMCDFQSKYKHNLRAHTRTHTSVAKLTRYRCKVCEYQSVRKIDIRRHVSTHKNTTETLMYKCDICTYHTKRKGYLQTHMLVHKSTAEVTMHKCEMCAYQTKHEGALRQHILRHLRGNSAQL